MQLDKERLQVILRNELEGQQDSAGRGVWTVDHCIRSAELALQLRQAAGLPETLDELVYTAALFHDVSHDSAEHNGHAAAGAKRMRQLLTSVVGDTLLEQAVQIVHIHDDRKPEDGRSDAAHLVQDADMIDHFGTLCIWATFGYSALHGRNLQDSLEHLQRDREKCIGYIKLMHFEVSRAELSRRLNAQQAFFELAQKEASGMLGN